MKGFILLPFMVSAALAQTAVPQGYNASLDKAHCNSWSGGGNASASFGVCDAPPPLPPETLVVEKVVTEEKIVTVPGPERIILKEVPKKKIRQ